MKKDVIYVDVDDEITSITDKIVSSKTSLLALVLPKRCTVLQSSVNMKILKKTADNNDKNIVLITSESSILPLAGTAGVYTAKTLQSKPFIPDSANAEEAIDTISEGEEAADKPIDPQKSIGELASKTTLSTAAVEEEAPIELGEEPSETTKDVKNKDQSPKDKKLKVPSFEKFRKRFFIVIAILIILIALWILAYVVLPKAMVTVTTNNSSVPVSLNAVASPTATNVDSSKNIVPAQVKQDTKTETQQFQATGQQNNGNKATGSVTLKDCDPNGDAITVPAGTTVTSNGLSFVTQSNVTLNWSTAVFLGKCIDTQASGLGTTYASVNVTASAGGDQYNLSGSRSYTISVPNVLAYAANGMSGGTNNIITIVSQSDCDGAKASLLSSNTSNFKNQLNSELTSAGLVPLTQTFSVTASTVSCNPAVGQQTTSSTATVQFSYSMTGASSTGLDQLIKAQAAQQIQSSQSVIDTGLSSADITVTQQSSNGNVSFSLQVSTLTGIKQDANTIAKSILGQKYGDSINTIENMPGVSKVTISYSPFWVSSTPKSTKHITVKFINNGS
jgi:hypothetical protein